MAGGGKRQAGSHHRNENDHSQGSEDPGNEATGWFPQKGSFLALMDMCVTREFLKKIAHTWHVNHFHLYINNRL